MKTIFTTLAIIGFFAIMINQNMASSKIVDYTKPISMTKGNIILPLDSPRKDTTRHPIHRPH